MSIDEQPMNVYWSGKRTETINRSKINYKGSVATFSDLPDTNNQKGDMYSVTGLNGENYIWDGTAWDSLGTSDANVVHLTGNERLQGTKTFAESIRLEKGIAKVLDTGTLYVCSASNASVNNGPYIAMYAKTGDSAAGKILIFCGTSAQEYGQLTLDPAGSISWNGQSLQTTSDQRLKTRLESVPDAVLDAWEDMDWGQFRYLDAVERKGENARLHLGVIAQRVKAVFEKHGLDACKYGILCHEERKTFEDLPAVDMWMVRYAEAFAMEAAYQRNKANKLEARIKAFEEKLK